MMKVSILEVNEYVGEHNNHDGTQNNTDAAANTDLALIRRVDMAARYFEAKWLPTWKWKTEWGFFVPAKSTLDDSSSLTIDCFLCHTAKIDTLHHRSPPALDEETQLVDDDVAFWAPAIPRTKEGLEAKHIDPRDAAALLCIQCTASSRGCGNYMLDPRLAGGSIVLNAINATTGNKDAAMRMAAALTKQFRVDVLINILVNMDNNIEAAKHIPCADKEGGTVASIGIVNDVDFMQMADETHDTMAVEERERDHRRMLVEDEWARYVTAAAQLRQSGGFKLGITLLDWWRENANHFPVVSELARIILCIHASQIECERVFSLEGLVIQHLRNNMGVEIMSTQVYITKNLDAAAEIQDILTKQYGSNIYDHTFSKKLQIPFELHHARQIATACEEKAPDNDCKGLALDRELAAS
jgi:hypothetical protein